MYDKGDFPNLFVIGAAKSGTSTIHSGLLKHPDIYMAPVKEPMFFGDDETYSKGLNWYLCAHFKGAHKYIIRGEATARYLELSHITAPRMKAIPELEGANFVAIFRDPVKRAQSDYWQQVRVGNEKMSFRKAIKIQLKRPGTAKENRYIGKEYFRGGQYAKLLEPFFENFSQDRFHFVLLEDLKSDFQGTFKEIFRFLELSAKIQLPAETKNPARLPRIRKIDQVLRPPWIFKESVKRFLPIHIGRRLKSYLRELNLRNIQIPPINFQLQMELLDAYEEDIQALEKILGRNLDVWRASS